MKERFGDDVFERVEKEGGIPQQFEASWGVKDWIFDKKVSCSTSISAASFGPSILL